MEESTDWMGYILAKDRRFDRLASNAPITWGELMTSRRIGFTALAAILLLCLQLEAVAQTASNQRQFLDRYCLTCHNDRLKTGGLTFERIDVSKPDAQAELWEKVVRKLRTGVMPPVNMLQPPKADRQAMVTWLETSLDAASAANPNPGRTETLRRLNRTEYQNTIKDLLALDRAPNLCGFGLNLVGRGLHFDDITDIANRKISVHADLGGRVQRQLRFDELLETRQFGKDRIASHGEAREHVVSRFIGYCLVLFSRPLMRRDHGNTRNDRA